MKSFAKLAIVGVSSIVLFKLLGLMFGLLAMTVKLALIAAVVFFLYSMLRRRKRGEELEVEVGP
jgi:uncharacterized membrane protein